MGGVRAYVRRPDGSPVEGATLELWGSQGISWGRLATALTDAAGYAWLEIGWGCIPPYTCYIIARKGTVSAQTANFQTDWECNGPDQTVVLNVVYPPAPQFEIVGLWVKHVNACAGNALIRAWDMLNQVGSPEPGHTHTWPEIPPYTPDMCGHNFQIEATVKNITSQTLKVRFRTQTCPRGSGPYQTPPCGLLVDSGAYVEIPPGGVVLLPIWQLQMWSENIDEHCWVVDIDGYVYNCLVRYFDNWNYRADDWYIPINAAGVGIPTAIPVFDVTGEQSGRTTVAPGERIYVLGALVRTDTSDPIASAAIHLYVDGIDYTTLYTDSLGKFSLLYPGFSTPGTHVFKAKFLGT